MADSQISNQNPLVIFQAALDALTIFTESKNARLEIKSDGQLNSSCITSLKKKVETVVSYMRSFFFTHIRQKQENRISEIKNIILHARDIVQSHTGLIEKFKEGNTTQREFAQRVLEAIHRYNCLVTLPVSHRLQETMYNYEKKRLLSDQEIQNRPIELPSISKYQLHPAYKILQEVSAIKEKTSYNLANPIHKKQTQFMIDTFRMKAIRMIEAHKNNYGYSTAEILHLIKNTAITIQENKENPLHSSIWQLLEISSNTTILLTGTFNKQISTENSFSMPMLNSFEMHPPQSAHSGFPSPSQYMGWALSHHWVEAFPLRKAQAPLFSQIYHQKKQFAEQFLENNSFRQTIRKHEKRQREIFDKERHLFIDLHQKMQHSIRKNLTKSNPFDCALQDFYAYVKNSSSAFDVFIQAEQQLIKYMIQLPFDALQEEWLSEDPTLLRLGTTQQKRQRAAEKLKEVRQLAYEQLDGSHPIHSYILQQGALLGEAFQTIVLQYQSEKMGFPPPILNEGEKKLQVYAFHQLATFLSQYTKEIENKDEQIRKNLLQTWEADLVFMNSTTIEKSLFALTLVNELEVYFKTRYEAYSPI
jgi:hypothetical protein